MKVQQDLMRGDDGTGKYLSITHSTLRRIAERKPGSLSDMARIAGMGDKQVDRFGEAFLEVLQEAS